MNQQGIAHYDLINTVLDAGMLPIVTMLHFDTPWMFVTNDNITARPDIGYIMEATRMRHSSRLL